MVRRPRQYRSGSGLKTFFVFALSVVCIIAREGRADDPAASTEAMVRIRAGQQAPQPISKYITGKFCEHLGTNIYNGMDAQILRNPTLAEYPFGTGQVTPDGIEAFQADQKQIVRQLREQAERIGWPEEELDRLAELRGDGLACWWIRQGVRQSVQVSPDTGPLGGRAQRVQTTDAGEGIAQWTCLPLHRTRRYEFEILARSPEVRSLSVSLFLSGAKEACAKAVVPGLFGTWNTFRGILEVDAQSPTDAVYRFAVTADSPGQFVVGAYCCVRPITSAGRTRTSFGCSGSRDCRSSAGPAATSSAVTTGRMRLVLWTPAQPGRITPGVESKQTCSAPTSSWLSAARWAASR